MHYDGCQQAPQPMKVCCISATQLLWHLEKEMDIAKLLLHIHMGPIVCPEIYVHQIHRIHIPFTFS